MLWLDNEWWRMRSRAHVVTTVATGSDYPNVASGRDDPRVDRFPKVWVAIGQLNFVENDPKLLLIIEQDRL